jgi:hypothetical protein
VLKAIAKEENVNPIVKKGANTTIIRTESNMSSRSVKSSALTVPQKEVSIVSTENKLLSNTLVLARPLAYLILAVIE